MRKVKNPVNGARIESLDLDPGAEVVVAEKVAQDAVRRWRFLTLGEEVEAKDVEPTPEATESPENDVEAPEAVEVPVEPREDNQDAVPLEELTVKELKELAKAEGVEGYSSLKKAELVKKLS